MKGFLLATLLSAPLLAQGHAELSQVQTVYMLRMRSGFDQHLANRLTASSVFRVVTDPAKADAVFTDRIGPTFEDRMKELYPPPAPAASVVEKDQEKESDSATGFPEIKSGEKPRSNAMGTTSGTVFLVDRRSNQVIWSTYARPKSYSSKDLDQVAGDIVKRIQETIQPGVKH